MRSLEKIIAAVLLLLFLSTAVPSMADIISAKIRSDTRHMIVFSEFEYSHTGYVSVTVSSVGISSIPVTSHLTQPDPSRIGFFLLSNELVGRYRYESQRNPGLCALDNKFIIHLFTFQNISSSPQSSFNKSYNVTYPGLYKLYLVNCNALSLVTMDVRAEFYNTNDNGTTRDYSELTPKSQLVGGGTLALISPEPLLLVGDVGQGLVSWIKLCFKNRQCVQMIHLPMGVLLVTTLHYYIYAAADQQDLKLTCTHHSVHVLFYIFQFLRNVLFFTVIVLIGAGWCFRKRFLPRWEIFFLTVVILLQVWVDLASTTEGESGPYKARFTSMNFICCMAVFLHSFFSDLLSEKTEDMTSLDRRTLFPFVVFMYLLITGFCFFLQIPRGSLLWDRRSALLCSL